MQSRKRFILDVHNGKINVSNWKWTELEEKYGYEGTSKAGDQIRKHYKWYESTGKNKGEWAPGEAIKDEDVSLGEEEEIEHSYLFPNTNALPPEGFDPKEFSEFLAWKKSKLDSSLPKEFTPGTYVVLGCTHVPFHNRPFFNAVLHCISDLKPRGLILAGDFMDMNSVSSHDKGQKPIADYVTLSWEYKYGNKALNELDSATDWEEKHYLYGNHEDRFWREMRKVDMAKLGEALINPTIALDLHARGYIVQEKWKEAKVFLGKHLEVFHGESTAVHSAKKNMDTFRTSIAYFHTHRIQSYVEGDTGSYNLGWGGDINSPAFNYASRAMKASWKNAFGVVIIDELGGFHIHTVVWHNNRFYYNGKEYT